jgi:ATP-binding protein involved in chromosome partitioning
MLTGQESIKELMAKNSHVEAILSQFGLTPQVVRKNKYTNLAHAAITLKQPLGKILEALAEAMGEEVKKPNVKGLDHHGHRSGGLRTGKIEGIKNIIAVHSGKGGVGKTFVAVNLAVYLAKTGCKVGLLDADIDCPNVMRMLKMKGKLVANCHNKIDPLEKFGVKVVSVAPMLPAEDDAVMWRGPVISRAVEQLVHDTEWGELDYLIIDMPPGTSDIPLSILHMLSNCKVLVVTTPQELSMLDAQRSIKMAQKMGREVVGLIENMSGEVFGEIGGGSRLHQSLKKEGIPVVGSIKLQAAYSRGGADGQPPVLSDVALEKIFSKILEVI